MFENDRAIAGVVLVECDAVRRSAKQLGKRGLALLVTMS